jgi:putative phosphoesterase
MPADVIRPAPDRATPEGIRLGIISDTHGYLNPAVASIFQGVRHIIHTGDIDAPKILSGLSRLAPVTAVRGNMDFGKWAARLPREEMITFAAVTIYALHDLTTLSLDPAAAGIDIVLSGHTHCPEANWQGNRLYLNPGSASLPRRGQSASVAIVTIDAGRIAHRFFTLADV